MEEGNNADVTRIVEERVQTNSLKEINGNKIFIIFENHFFFGLFFYIRFI